ncbi:hypothetical protein M0R45_036603 [Rubus argutus]|uniref:Uncharacterized protein n=1 Tax=Rubus argutus TaxID=59490 RepID=A0AAW1VWJ8_RUBAR
MLKSDCSLAQDHHEAPLHHTASLTIPRLIPTSTFNSYHCCTSSVPRRYRSQQPRHHRRSSPSLQSSLPLLSHVAPPQLVLCLRCHFNHTVVPLAPACELPLTCAANFSHQRAKLSL